MKVLVFAKQIPDVNQISFDPETKRIVRENVPLLINSFDKKAVEEAIRIGEKHGWETIIATMGPPQSKEILNESLRMGIDKAYLITDRKFAGADTLITSKILSRTVALLNPDLVLMGKYSLDGETSQVPPEVAVLSGYGFKSSVSKIEIEANSKSCLIEHENEAGLTEYRVGLPAVISVSEKINRARSIKEGTPQLYERIETLDSKKLGVDLQGARDSPTVVTGTDSLKSEREVRLMDYGDEVFPAIVDIIEREVKEEGVTRITLKSFDPAKRSIMGVAIDEGRVSREIASRISLLALKNDLNVIMAGNIDPDALEGMGCHKYYHVDANETDVIAKTLTELIKELGPSYVIFPSTVAGREVSAMIAATLDLGLTADCVDIEIDEGSMVQYKPAFGGGIVASIISRTSPAMATVRPGMFKLLQSVSDYEKHDVRVASEPANEKIRFEPVSSDFRPLNSSVTVIGVGRGLKSKSNLVQVLELAERLSASVGGTRPVVDMRWMPRQQQIGLTGISISPNTYLAIGISGQDNHVVGIRYARKVIAVNTDGDAPVFKYADLGIIADSNDFVTKFNQYLSERD